MSIKSPPEGGAPGGMPQTVGLALREERRDLESPFPHPRPERRVKNELPLVSPDINI